MVTACTASKMLKRHSLSNFFKEERRCGSHLFGPGGIALRVRISPKGILIDERVFARLLFDYGENYVVRKKIYSRFYGCSKCLFQ